MSDNDLKPENVRESSAEAYLQVCGWAPVPSGSPHTGKWLKQQPLMMLSRGEALLYEYQRDLVRMTFVLRHAKSSVLAMMLFKGVLAVAESVAGMLELEWAEQLRKAREGYSRGSGGSN